MICQKCQQNPASIHVVDVPESWVAGAQGENAAREHILCECCAQSMGIPSDVPKPPVSAIFKLLQISGKKHKLPSCPDCGTNLMEFRQKGRLGCPKDYEVFADHLSEILERVHGATEHVGRVPGVDEEASTRRQRLADLQKELDQAIQSEAYETAAKLRDELKSLRAS